MAKWMDSSDWYVRTYRGEVIKDIEDIIRSACGIRTGQNFKHGVPLQQLISYKADANNQDRVWGKRTEAEVNNEKFRYFTAAVEDIVTRLNKKYPFIDMTGIGLTWTADQVIDAFMEIYTTMPVRALKDKENAQ